MAVKRLIIFVTLPLMLIVGAGMGAILFGLIPGFDPLGTQKHAKVEEPKEPVDPYKNEAPPPFAESPPGSIIFQLDEFVINLQTERRYPVFMLLSLALEARNEAAQGRISTLEPRIRDAVIIYASSLSQDQLSGYDGITKLRTGIWLKLRNIVENDDLVNIQVMKMTIK